MLPSPAGLRGAWCDSFSSKQSTQVLSISSEGAQHIPRSNMDTYVLSPGFMAGSSQEQSALGIMWKKCAQLLVDEL